MIRYLRRAGMTQQVLENVPERRLSRKALSPCFKPRGITSYTSMSQKKEWNTALIQRQGFSIIDIPPDAKTPPSGSRRASEKALLQTARPTYSCLQHLPTCLLCNLSRWQLHSVVSNKRRNRFSANALMTGDWDTNHKWRLSDSNWNYSLPCEIAQ